MFQQRSPLNWALALWLIPVVLTSKEYEIKSTLLLEYSEKRSTQISATTRISIEDVIVEAGNILSRITMKSQKIDQKEMKLPVGDSAFVLRNEHGSLMGIYSLSARKKWSPVHATALNLLSRSHTMQVPFQNCQQSSEEHDGMTSATFSNCLLVATKSHSLVPTPVDLTCNQTMTFAAAATIASSVDLHCTLSRQIKQASFGLHERSTIVEIGEQKDDSADCNGKKTIDDCLLELKAQPAATRDVPENSPGALFKLDMLVDMFREAVAPMGEGVMSEESSGGFIELVRAARSSSVDELSAVIRKPDNDALLPVLADVLAAAGTAAALRAARQTLAAEDVELARRFAISLAQSPNVADWLIDGLIEWHESKGVQPELRQAIAVGLTRLVYRHCTANGDCDAGNKHMRKTVDLFQNRFAKCKTRICMESNFHALQGLPNAGTLAFAEAFLCAPEKQNGFEATMALKIIGAIDPTRWSSKLVDKLLRLFHNQCGQKTVFVARMMAGICLVERSRGDDNLLPRILWRFKSVATQNERELFALVRSKLAHAAAQHAAFAASLLAAKRAVGLVANYNSLAGALSTSNGVVVSEDAGARGWFGFELLFGSSAFRRSVVSAGLSDQHGVAFPMFSFELFAEGLQSVMGGGGDEAAEDDDAATDPTAGMRVGAFGADSPPVTFFTGHGTLMATVFHADGRTHTIFDANYLLQEQTLELPFAAGLVLQVDATAALSTKVVGSIDISLWYRSSHSQVITNGSLALKLNAELRGVEEAPVYSQEVLLSVVGGINFVTDVDFYEDPFQLCMRIHSSPISIRFEQNESSKRKPRVVKRTTPGRSLLIDPKMSLLCTQLLKKLDIE